MEKLYDVKELKHNLLDTVKNLIETKGIYSPEVNTEEVGEVIDMIKDLAQAEKDCLETEYYCTVIEAMGGADRREGYNNRRYNDGRYAPKDRGHYSGYTPMMPIYMNKMDEYGYDRMGYPSNGRGGSDNFRNGNYGRSGYPHYGMAYDDYLEARRYYHESNDPSAREKMKYHADEHVHQTIDSFKDIWDNADMEEKKKMKGALSKFVAEMAI